MLAPKSNANQHLNSYFLVRLGTMGHVGRFRPAEPENYRRGERVVCRTARGIEVGVTLGPAELPGDVTEDMADGRLLRKMTAEDELLWGHLQQLGSDAHRSCIEWLDAQGVAATLVEVEPLLDGRTLYFHFLSDVAPEVQLQLDKLVSLYESEVQKSKFARLLEHGCGPGCGTDKAVNGCGPKGGCAVCKIASQCKTGQTH